MWPLLLTLVAASLLGAPASAQQDEVLRIDRVGDQRTTYVWDELLEVPGGRVTLLEVRILARHPILTVWLDGKLYARPKRAEYTMQVPYLLYPGANAIEVKAATLTRDVTRTFTITVQAPRGHDSG